MSHERITQERTTKYTKPAQETILHDRLHKDISGSIYKYELMEGGICGSIS